MSSMHWNTGRHILLDSSPFACLIGLAMIAICAAPYHAADSLPASLRSPFHPDEYTVVLYHFDEGEGDKTKDALGDSALTLWAYKEASWGEAAGVWFDCAI